MTNTEICEDLVQELNNCETLESLNVIARAAQSLQKQHGLTGEDWDRVVAAGKNRRSSLSKETPW
jgi:hypothetical protein